MLYDFRGKKKKVNSSSNYNELKIVIQESYPDPEKLGQIITLKEKNLFSWKTTQCAQRKLWKYLKVNNFFEKKNWKKKMNDWYILSKNSQMVLAFDMIF